MHCKAVLKFQLVSESPERLVVMALLYSKPYFSLLWDYRLLFVRNKYSLVWMLLPSWVFYIEKASELNNRDFHRDSNSRGLNTI